MFNGFVGEFLILTGSMQANVAHRHLWTALATTGVIFSAAYMLTLIQRVFYRGLSKKAVELPARDLDVREHLALWPMVILFLVMGLASPLWMRAIDTFGVTCSVSPAPVAAAVIATASSSQGGR
jgi:NADH-quinone oxidoreductase subunit M